LEEKHMLINTSLIFGLLIGCGEEEPEKTTDPLSEDADGDGVIAAEDCDDEDSGNFPGNDETCDGADNDCDGEIDNDASDGSDFYADTDGDGFGDPDASESGCEAWDGYVEDMSDCDDGNPDVNPDAAEVCDGEDNDCNGDIDDDDAGVDASSGAEYWADEDGDGYGDMEASGWMCEWAEGYADNGTDCDDWDAELNNDDADGDGLASCPGDDGMVDCDDGNNTVGATDEDGDGYIACLDDCNDWDADVNAGDGDGDGMSTCEGDCDDTDATAMDIDEDGDGFSACNVDCDDASATTFPGAAENDSEEACMADGDEDGYGDANPTVDFCGTLELFDSYGDSWNGAYLYVYLDGEMADTYTLEYADGGYGVWEVCYSGSTIELEYSEGYFDSENSWSVTVDGEILFASGGDFGLDDPTADNGFSAASWIDAGSDCDDADAAVSSIDEDGDGYSACVDDCDDSAADEDGDGVADGAAYNPGDADGDGYDSCDWEMPDCDDSDAAVNPSVDGDGDGYSVCDDCDDADAEISPDAEDVAYDGIDSDCDGWSDYDADWDGHDSMDHGGDDCDDDDGDVHPGLAGEDPAICMEDYDGDGYGDDEPSNAAATAGSDCNDGSPYTHPGAAYMEADLDGDGVDDCSMDYDGDGYGSDYAGSNVAGTDCDDYDEFIFPGAAEMDSETECMADYDDDGYGDSDVSSYDDHIEGTDCDDDDAAVYPGIDADADSIDICDDCDDADAAVGSHFLAYDDYDADGYGDDNDEEWICDLDEDGDGTDDWSLIGGDCDDWDADENPGVDGDGDTVNVCEDCDDDDDTIGAPWDAYMDADGDGFGSFHAEMVCAMDSDDDGTDDYLSVSGDCDDNDAWTHPGAAESDSESVCLRDTDEDGYGEMGGCYTLIGLDSYGDGWDSYSGDGTVDLYVDGVWDSSYMVEEDQAEWLLCVATGSEVAVGYTEPGSFNSEVAFALFSPDGTELMSTDWAPDGADVAAGDTPLWSGTAGDSGGSDLDDTDGTVGH
jgi:hypothetical protein